MIKQTIVILLMMLLIPCISAGIEELGTFEKDECVELLQICSNCTFNNITSIVFPNSTIAVEDVSMTRQDTRYNYTFCEANVSGVYIVNGLGDLDGTDEVWNYIFKINPTGIEATDQRTSSISRAVMFFLILAVILFIGFLFLNFSPPVKWTFFIFSVIFFVSALNIISISLADEVVNPNIESFFDSITAISFIFYWFAGGLLILLWIFTFLNTFFFKKNLKAAQKYAAY